MLVRYKFVNETVEIEVSEEWGKALAEQDRLEYNNEQKETRRHASLDAARDSGVELAVTSTALGKHRLRSVIELLAKDERELVESLFIVGLSQSEFASLKGIRQSSVSRRVVTLRKKLENLSDDAYFDPSRDL